MKYLLGKPGKPLQFRSAACKRGFCIGFHRFFTGIRSDFKRSLHGRITGNVDKACAANDTSLPLLLLLALAFLLSACVQPEPPVEPIQPVRFYYRTVNTDFFSEEGIICAETRDLGTQTFSDLELFQLYLAGPSSPNLVSPIAQGTELTHAFRSSGTMELYMKRSINAPAVFNHALTHVCLAKTALDLDGIRKVHIKISNFDGDSLSDVTLTQSDILLYDSGKTSESLELTLYYTNHAGNLLLAEKRQIPLLEQEELPQKAMELLLSPPETPGLRSALPLGTAVLDLSVDNGICTVDFNGDFLYNRPDTEQGEQLALLSIVNTLCELDNINQVSIYVEGRKLQQYLHLSLSSPWILDNSVTGPIREELGEFSGTLCLPDPETSLLHRLKIRAKAKGNTSKELTLLLMLLERSSQNGLQNPLIGIEAPLSFSADHGICRINFASGHLPEDPQTRELSLRCIVATLCSLPWINAVEVRIDGFLLTPEPRKPDASWFVVPPAS